MSATVVIANPRYTLNGFTKGRRLLIKLRQTFLQESVADISEVTMAAITAQLVEYFPKHTGRDFITYIAEINGEAVATAFLTIMERPANHSLVTGKSGRISNVYVFPEYRKQGIATQLMNLLAEEARTVGLSYIELSATESGKHVYEKLGYKLRYTEMKLVL